MKTNRKIKRIFAWILSAIIVVGLVSVTRTTSHAQESETGNKVVWDEIIGRISIHGKSQSQKVTIDDVTLSIGNGVNAFSKSQFQCFDRGGFRFTNSLGKRFTKIVIHSDDDEFMAKYAENPKGLGTTWEYTDGSVTWTGKDDYVDILSGFNDAHDTFTVNSIEFFVE